MCRKYSKQSAFNSPLRMRLLVSALCMIMLGSGCMKVITEIHVKKDGSGVITETIYIAKAITSLAEEFGDSKEEVMPPVDRVKGIIRAQKMGKGVRFVSSQQVAGAQGQHGIKTVFAFDDIRELKLGVEPDSLVADFSPQLLSQRPGEKPRPLRFSFNPQPLPTLTVHIPYDTALWENENTAADTAGSRKKNTSTGIWRMLSGFGIWIRIKVDGTIEKTNATYVNNARNGVSLLKMDFSQTAMQIGQDSSGIGELNSVYDFSSARRILSKVPGISIETQANVNIAFR
jgi:hypothetical protein